MSRILFGLRFRLILLVTIAILPALGGVIYSASKQRQWMGKAGELEALRLARLAATEQNRLIEGTRQMLIVLAQLPMVRERDSEKCNALFGALVAESPLYGNLGAIEADGHLFCGAFPVNEPIDTEDLTYFKRALLDRDFAIGDFHISPVTGKASLNFGYPVLSKTGDVQSVVFVTLDLEWLNGMVGNAKLPAGSTFTVIDSQGMVLAYYPDGTEHVGKILPQSPVARAILAHQEEGTIEGVGEDGVPRLYAFTPLAGDVNGRVYVGIGIPSEVAYAPVNRALVFDIVLLGGVMLLSTLAAWFGGDIFLLRRLNKLVHATQRLSSGDLSVRTGIPKGPGELGQLTTAFDQMAEALERREKERQEVQEALQRYADRLRALATRLAEAEEAERHRLACELHDRVGQNLTALSINQSIMINLLSPESRGKLGSRLDDSVTLLDETMQCIRDMMVDLRPPVLDDYGLAAALRWYLERFSERTGLKTIFDGEEFNPRLPPLVETALFRIAQEALTNVVRHAHADRVTVTLGDEMGSTRLTISDDGVGFDPKISHSYNEHPSWGLITMRERAMAIGCHLRVESGPGTGTTVFVEMTG